MEYRSSGKGKTNKKTEIIQYIFEHKNASKTELTKALGISMPTVLQSTKELLEQGLLVEVGEYESTGGRRAKSLAINGAFSYAIGVDVTTEHLSLALINMAGEPVCYKRIPQTFINAAGYYHRLSDSLDDLIKESSVRQDQILGLGVALPGNINDDEHVLIKSHALNLEGINLKMVEAFSRYPIHFENDANAAMTAEQEFAGSDAIYLFLSNTVGSAIKTDSMICRGRNRKAGEVGHVILVPGGRPCYCGKRGCVDSYCSVRALETESGMSLETFMDAVKRQEPEVMAIWSNYLENLAITISNLRMIYDTDIILGGDMGEYLESYMLELGKRVVELNKFDTDTSYLKISRYKKDGAAIGAALHFIYQYFEHMT